MSIVFAIRGESKKFEISGIRGMKHAKAVKRAGKGNKKNQSSPLRKLCEDLLHLFDVSLQEDCLKRKKNDLTMAALKKSLQAIIFSQKNDCQQHPYWEIEEIQQEDKDEHALQAEECCDSIFPVHGKNAPQASVMDPEFVASFPEKIKLAFAQPSFVPETILPSPINDLANQPELPRNSSPMPVLSAEFVSSFPREIKLAFALAASSVPSCSFPSALQSTALQSSALPPSALRTSASPTSALPSSLQLDATKFPQAEILSQASSSSSMSGQASSGLKIKPKNVTDKFDPEPLGFSPATASDYQYDEPEPIVVDSGEKSDFIKRYITDLEVSDKSRYPNGQKPLLRKKSLTRVPGHRLVENYFGNLVIIPKKSYIKPNYVVFKKTNFSEKCRCSSCLAPYLRACERDINYWSPSEEEARKEIYRKRYDYNKMEDRYTIRDQRKAVKERRELFEKNAHLEFQEEINEKLSIFLSNLSAEDLKTIQS